MQGTEKGNIRPNRRRVALESSAIIRSNYVLSTSTFVADDAVKWQGIAGNRGTLIFLRSGRGRGSTDTQRRISIFERRVNNELVRLPTHPTVSDP